MKNNFSKLGGCSACALRVSGRCETTAILHCDFFEETQITARELAEKILQALNDSGAELGNASIDIIEKEIKNQA